MIKVSDAVIQLLEADEVALEAFRAGLLNLSAYAEQIKEKVEKATFKEVQKGTIVVALSRIAKTSLKQTPALKPDIKVANLSVKSPLCALTYDKTVDIQRRVSTLNPFLVAPTDLFSVIDGVTEVALTCSEKSKEFIKNHMGVTPKKETSNLVAVTIQFPEQYNEIPNVLHVLLSAFASKRINLVEVISTYTETSFVVDKSDMEEVVRTLNLFS